MKFVTLQSSPSIAVFWFRGKNVFFKIRVDVGEVLLQNVTMVKTEIEQIWQYSRTKL